MRALIVLVLVSASAPARADGTLDLASPVADDGATAPLVNPAGLARRDTTRAQLGVSLVDDDARYDAGGGLPVQIARGSSALAPLVGGETSLGPLVVGVGYVDQVLRARAFPQPASGQPAGDVDTLFPGRYAGLATSLRVRTLAAGASWRANDWLAIGASVTASRVSLDETRRVWAGFAGRDTLGDASRDVTVRLWGDDPFVPGVAAGALVAPIDTPVELGASIAWSARASIDGDVTATAGAPTSGPEVQTSGSGASTSLAQPLVIRTGARWLAERWIAEIGGALWLYPQDPAAAWRIHGVTIVDDVTQKTAPLDALGSQLARRGHGALRASLDVEVVPGLVWMRGAWSWASAATPTDRLSPAAGDLGGHTLALDADLSAGSFTVSLGIARTFASATDVRVTRLTLDNPFAAGDAPTGLGTHDEARDVIAITLEAEK